VLAAGRKAGPEELAGRAFGLAATRRRPLELSATWRTVRRPDELVTALLVPAHGPRVRSSFVKLGARRYLVISIVMVAATVELDDADRVTGAAVAVGACTPVATRLPALEARLRGCVAGALEDEVRDADLSGLSPLTDVRGTAAFRLDAAAQLIRRALRALGDG